MPQTRRPQIMPQGPTTVSGTVATAPATPGQANMAASAPVVIASNQTAIPVSGTVTANISGTVPVSGTFWQATQPISGNVGITGSVAVTGTFWQATQPVSGTVTANAGTGTFAVSGPLTDTQLRASAVPMSLAALPALVTGTAIVGKVGIDQTTPGTTNKVSIGTDGTVAINAAIPTGANVIGALTANQSVNVAQMNGVAVTMGSGVTGTGVQRVVLATDVALPTGANVIGALTANQSVNQTQVNGVTMLTGNGATGTGSMRVTIASDNTAFSVNAVQSGSWSLTANQSVNLNQVGGTAVATNGGVTGAGVQRVVLATDVGLPAGTNTLGTTTGPTLTKGTQGSSGYSTQDLKDAGRVIVNAATAIAGVTAVTTEALIALNVSRDGAATSSISTIPVTSGKRFRVTHMVVGLISTAAAVLSGRFSLRMNPSGAATASSPIIATLPIPSGAALAQAGGSLCITIPDGIEFSGTQQVGISQVCSAITGTVWASLIGFEY